MFPIWAPPAPGGGSVLGPYQKQSSEAVARLQLVSRTSQRAAYPPWQIRPLPRLPMPAVPAPGRTGARETAHASPWPAGQRALLEPEQFFWSNYRPHADHGDIHTVRFPVQRPNLDLDQSAGGLL